MRSPQDAQTFSSRLQPFLAEMRQALNELGIVHYSRFLVLSERTIIFLADYDGELENLLRGFAQKLGPVFDMVFAETENPPATPIAENVDAFIKWATDHNGQPVAVYTAYPTASVQTILAKAREADFSGDSEQLPFLVILPLKSDVAAFTLQQVVFRVAGKILVDGSDTVGTLHLAHFVPLEDNKLGFFTVYDGPFDKYIQDFAEKLGPVFDLLFKFVIDPPPTPTAKNAEELTHYIAKNDLPPIGMYSAYPGLTTQDVNALLADG